MSERGSRHTATVTLSQRLQCDARDSEPSAGVALREVSVSGLFSRARPRKVSLLAQSKLLEETDQINRAAVRDSLANDTTEERK
jgi:hypothetical protein